MTRMLLIASLLWCAWSLSASDTYRILPDGSTVGFAGSSTIHDFTGTAQVIGGSFSLKPSHVAGFIEVDCTSMNTKDADRDAEMHKDHMESAKYPRIRFDVTAFTPGADASTGSVQGTWTMHGASRPMQIPVTMTLGAKPRLHASFPIDMRLWAITPPKKLLVISVDPMITVTVDLTLAADDAAPTSATSATQDHR
jgi:polyisoprenoid-binding protein YceI